ncbi:MAG: class I SAM-dependent methyltransferase [Trebonia sp.]
MSATGHAARMAATYSTGVFARTVAAGGNPGLMNLGFADDPHRPGSTARRQRRLAGLVLAAINPVPGQALLDVGCGKGGMANLIGQLAPGMRVMGVNIDLHQLAIARRRQAPGVGFTTGDAERLPFAAAAFDTVYAIEVLSHIGDKKAFFGELVRVLRPGGRLVLAVITLTRPYSAFGPDERMHLVRVADLFSERPEDIPMLAEVHDLLAAVGLRVSGTRDLTAGVFRPRHDTFVRMRRWACHRNPLAHAAFATAVALRWRLRAREFTAFLMVNTEMDPVLFYEYHLLTGESAKEEDVS